MKKAECGLLLIILLFAVTTPLCFESDEFVWPSELPELKVNEETFKKQNLECHNEYRKIHGVYPLLSSTKLDIIALKYAVFLANGEERSIPSKYKSYSISKIKLNSFIFDGTHACKIWYSTEYWYDYSKGKNEQSKNVDVFKHLLSRASCFVGIGVAKSTSNEVHIVAFYDPPDSAAAKIFPPGYSLRDKLNPFELLMLTPVCTNSEKLKYIEQNLQCHNTLRKMHGVPPLEYSDELTKYAEDLANFMAFKNSLIQREGRYKDCAIISKGERLLTNGYHYCQVWYEKTREYDAQYFHSLDDRRNMKNEVPCYSQMIWNSTRYMGFAIDLASDGSIYTVAVYDPPGNIRGEYKNNIFPDYLNSLSNESFQTSIYSFNPYIAIFCLYLINFQSGHFCN